LGSLHQPAGKLNIPLQKDCSPSGRGASGGSTAHAVRLEMYDRDLHRLRVAVFLFGNLAVENRALFGVAQTGKINKILVIYVRFYAHGGVDEAVQGI